jgi:WD40 repeat protein
MRPAISLTFLVLLGSLAAAQAPMGRELKGHTSVVYSVSFSPDGKTLATGSFDNTIKLWDFAAGKEAKELKGHTGPVYCVAFSPDGQTLASSSLDKTIKLWSVAEGKELKSLAGHADVVDMVAWSPDGKLLASCGGNADKSVRLWNPAEGKEVKNLGVHGNGVYVVAFSKDGKLLASGGVDGAIKIWDVAGQKELKTLLPYQAKTEKDPERKGHKDAVTNLAFSLDGKTLYSIGFDQLLHVWDVEKGVQTKELGPMKDMPFGIALAADGKTLLTSGYGGQLTLWDLAQDKPMLEKDLKTIDKTNFGAYCVAFSPDGKFAVTGHDKNKVVITPLTP